jgi:hypothetical protein
MAKKRRPPVLPREAIDTGPPERARHGGVEVVAIKPGAGHATENVARVLHEHVLDVLWRRDHASQTRSTTLATGSAPCGNGRFPRAG